MDNKDLQKAWKIFLIDIDKSETELAKELGTAQQGLNRKIKDGTIKYIELANILERYGYNITIRRND